MAAAVLSTFYSQQQRRDDDSVIQSVYRPSIHPSCAARALDRSHLRSVRNRIYRGLPAFLRSVRKVFFFCQEKIFPLFLLGTVVGKETGKWVARIRYTRGENHRYAAIKRLPFGQIRIRMGALSFLRGSAHLATCDPLSPE